MTKGVRNTGEDLIATRDLGTVELQAVGQRSLPVTLLRVPTDNLLNSTLLRPVFTSEVIPKQGVHSNMNLMALHAHRHGNLINVLDSTHQSDGTGCNQPAEIFEVRLYDFYLNRYGVLTKVTSTLRTQFRFDCKMKLVEGVKARGFKLKMRVGSSTEASQDIESFDHLKEFFKSEDIYNMFTRDRSGKEFIAQLMLNLRRSIFDLVWVLGRVRVLLKTINNKGGVVLPEHQSTEDTFQQHLLYPVFKKIAEEVFECVNKAFSDQMRCHFRLNRNGDTGAGAVIAVTPRGEHADVYFKFGSVVDARRISSLEEHVAPYQALLIDAAEAYRRGTSEPSSTQFVNYAVQAINRGELSFVTKPLLVLTHLPPPTFQCLQRWHRSSSAATTAL